MPTQGKDGPGSHKTIDSNGRIKLFQQAVDHYPTSVLDAIKSRDVPSIAANDCVLFLWATIPMLPHALAVMEACGIKVTRNPADMGKLLKAALG